MAKAIDTPITSSKVVPFAPITGANPLFPPMFDLSEATELAPGPNDQWTKTNLPSVRIALLLLTKDVSEFEKIIREFRNADGDEDDLLSGLEATLGRFEAYAEILRWAIERYRATMERPGAARTLIPCRIDLDAERLRRGGRAPDPGEAGSPHRLA